MNGANGIRRLLLGRLSLDAIPYHEPILVGTFVVVALGAGAVLAALTHFRAWGPLWRDWITSTDHKRIGVMYVVLGLIMLLRGFSDAIMKMMASASSMACRVWRAISAMMPSLATGSRPPVSTTR